MDADDGLELLRESVRAAISNDTVISLAYSGGLDSSILAALARERAKVRCYTCVVAGSFDARNARDRATSESLELEVVELTAGDIPAMVREASRVLGTSNPTQLAYTIPILVVLKASQERLMLAGNGADELFGGYQKYVSAPDPGKLMADDLGKMLREAEAMDLAAKAIGKRVAFPFVSKELIEFSKSLALDRKISSSGRKVLLRDIAGLLNLSSGGLPKKAAQYSSGVLKEMRRLAKSDGLSLSHWTRSHAEVHQRSA